MDDPRFLAVQALLDGFDADQVAEAHGIHRWTVFRWLSRYQHAAEEGLLRKPGSGRARKLEDLSENGLERVVLRPASDFGYETTLWTAGRLQAVIQQQYRIKVSKDTVWRRLREAGLTYQNLERQYHETDKEVRQEWVRKNVPKIRKSVPKRRAILYFQDGSNVSLAAFCVRPGRSGEEHQRSR